jgi:hypothetical protein
LAKFWELFCQPPLKICFLKTSVVIKAFFINSLHHTLQNIRFLKNYELISFYLDQKKQFFLATTITSLRISIKG